jgi:hypothetical protein
MKRFLCLAVLLGISVMGRAQGSSLAAQDDAAQAAYGASWADGTNGGSGYGPWKQQTLTGEGESHAGFYIVVATDHPDLKGAAKDGKAFGFYANGTGYEIASAFRPFARPVAVGQLFVVSFQVGPFEKKFATDSPSGGSVGITLRSGNEANSTDDYNKGARFEFGTYAGSPNYQIYDGEENHDTGVPFSDGGVKLKFTLVTADTYNLEVTTLADQKMQTLAGRKLGGTAGGQIESFCLFDRNWEKNDAYFNDFEVGNSSGADSPAASPSPTASATPIVPPAPGTTPGGL